MQQKIKYTRYPVYDGDIDHITGLIHVKDLYSLSLKDEVCPIEKLQRKIMLVPETITMDNLVIEFKKNKAQMAVVVDEFGGTSGIITLEDVLEEIFGDVQDEFDEEAEIDIKEIKPNHYLVNGMMRLDELANFFDIPEEKLEEALKLKNDFFCGVSGYILPIIAGTILTIALFYLHSYLSDVIFGKIDTVIYELSKYANDAEALRNYFVSLPNSTWAVIFKKAYFLI